ncbi:MAG: hypothetical protein VKO21_10740 [Candidatus Sericytochromatia bacterium]|nr:hypothetical protein [Candidatus Sericytochromatia bacterium]
MGNNIWNPFAGFGGASRPGTGSLASRTGLPQLAGTAQPEKPEAPATRDNVKVNKSTTGPLSRPVSLNRLLTIFQNRPQVLELLVSLEKQGVLSANDMAGVSVAQNLALLVATPASRSSKITGPLGKTAGLDFASHVIEHLAKPDDIFQGEATKTCTVTVAQAVFAARHPADYARMVRELVQDGQSKTRKGDVVTTDGRGFKTNEGRDPVEDLLQESLMTFAQNRFPAEGEQRAGRVYSSTAKRGGTEQASLSDSQRNLALTDHQYGQVLKSLTSENYLPVSFKPVGPLPDRTSEARHLLRQLDVMREAAERGPVPLGVAGHSLTSLDDLGHAVALKSMKIEPETETRLRALLDAGELDRETFWDLWSEGSQAEIFDPATGETSLEKGSFLKEVEVYFISHDSAVLLPDYSAIERHKRLG